VELPLRRRRRGWGRRQRRLEDLRLGLLVELLVELLLVVLLLLLEHADQDWCQTLDNPSIYRYPSLPEAGPILFCVTISFSSFYLSHTDMSF
jgi:hypothetical protein